MELTTSQINNLWRGFKVPQIDREMEGTAKNEDLFHEGPNIRAYKTSFFYFIVNKYDDKLMIFLENEILVCKGELRISQKIADAIHLNEASKDKIKAIHLPEKQSIFKTFWKELNK